MSNIGPSIDNFEIEKLSGEVAISRDQFVRLVRENTDVIAEAVNEYLRRGDSNLASAIRYVAAT